MSYKPNIGFLKKNKDVEGLVEALRYPLDALTRREAAQALGELDDMQVVDSLIRSALEDPDYTVQAAAHGALTRLLGNQAGNAIAVYKSGQPDPEPWIMEEQPTTDASPENGDFIASVEMPDWSEQEINTLITIVKKSSDTKLRLRAISKLAQCREVMAVDALISVALWSDERQIRSAAQNALEEIYGDDYQKILDDYQADNAVQEQDEEYLDEDSDEPGD